MLKRKPQSIHIYSERFKESEVLKKRDFEDFQTKFGVETMELDPSGDDARDLSNTSQHPKKKRRHRHTPHQIQELEAFFKDCPNPNDKRRREVSRELGLEPWQVKFWCQNKRTKLKAQHEHHENVSLKAENEKLWAEVLGTATCHNCGGRTAFSEMYSDNQYLRDENARLKNRLEKIFAIASKDDEDPLISNSSHLPPQLSFRPPDQLPTQSGFVEETYGGINFTGSVSTPLEERGMHLHEFNDLDDELAMINQFDFDKTPKP